MTFCRMLPDTCDIWYVSQLFNTLDESADVKVLLRSAAAMSISHLRYENRICEVQAADAFSKRS